MCEQELTVIKRDGRSEPFKRSKVLARLGRLCPKYDKIHVSLLSILTEVEKEVSTRTIVTSTYIDDFMAKTAAKWNKFHPDYLYLAGNIAATKLHKQTLDSFSKAMDILYNMKRMGCADERTPELSKAFHTAVMNNADKLDKAIDHERDLTFTYFSLKLLEEKYLFRLNGKVIESPQYMFMRISLDIHKDDIDAALESYELMSLRHFIHSTATMISAGTVKAQMCSNYGIVLPSHPEGVFECLNQCSEVSKRMGNVAIYCHDYPSRYSETLSGIARVLALFQSTYTNNILLYGNNVGNFTFYVELWHADLHEILFLIRINSLNVTDINISVLVPEYFMQRLEENQNWSLMCPTDAPGLGKVCGGEFEELYTKYESGSKSKRNIRANCLWEEILKTQSKSGGKPSIVFKKPYYTNISPLSAQEDDKSRNPLHHLTSSKDMSVYPSAFIAINRLHQMNSLGFKWSEFRKVVEVVTRNLDKIIDINFYPVPKAKTWATKNRAIAMGVHGLADLAQILLFPFDSNEMADCCSRLFEMMYFYALEESTQLAELYGPYKNYTKHPITPGFVEKVQSMSYHICWNWPNLAVDIDKHGLRNSAFLTVEPSPTLAQLLDTSNSVEPYISNFHFVELYGEKFTVFNMHLVRQIKPVIQWNRQLRRRIMENNGSLKDIQEPISTELKEIFKTAWELDPLFTRDVARQRELFVDHNQAMYYYGHADSTLELVQKINECQKLASNVNLKSAFCRVVKKTDIENPLVSVDTDLFEKAEPGLSQNTREKLDQINMSTLCFGK